MALGKRVEELRNGKQWTQPQLCAKVNAAQPQGDKQLTQQALDRLEKRDSDTSVFAPALADVFEVSLRWLLSGRGQPHDTDWPFKRVARSRWDDCDAEERAYVQGVVDTALTQCEAMRVKGSRKLQSNGKQ